MSKRVRDGEKGRDLGKLEKGSKKGKKEKPSQQSRVLWQKGME